MNKKITVLSSIILCAAIFVTVIGFGIDGKKIDTTNVAIDVKYADDTTATTNAIGSLIENVAGGNVVGDALGSAGQNIGSALEGVTGNLSGAVGNVNDALGNIGNGNGLAGVVGDLGDTIGNISGVINGLTSTTAKSTTELDTIAPVPAASQYDTQVANPIVTQNTTEATTVASDSTGETVDYSATSNPYKKPTIELKAGDKDSSVKWVQWIFIYTHYGLAEDGITGELDEATVHLIKKFQTEKGLTVNGDMTKDFVDSLELYFYECTFGTSSTTTELAQPTQMETVASVNEGEENSNIAILIVALIFIWVLAIIAIVVLIVFLKKKNGAAKNAQATATSTASADAQNKQENTEEKSQKTLEDLFNE